MAGKRLLARVSAATGSKRQKNAAAPWAALAAKYGRDDIAP